MELICSAGLMGDLVDVMVEGLGVLDGRGKGVVLVVQLGEEVIPLQAKLPVRPSPTWLFHPPVCCGVRTPGRFVDSRGEGEVRRLDLQIDAGLAW
jgi:hypothetical protein